MHCRSVATPETKNAGLTYVGVERRHAPFMKMQHDDVRDRSENELLAHEEEQREQHEQHHDRIGIAPCRDVD